VTALIRPDAARFDEWAAMVAEFRDEQVFPYGSGIQAPVTGTREQFDGLLERAALFAAPAATLPDGYVRSDHYWIVDPAGLIGFLMFRHRLNDFLLHEGGNIGYSVRPSRRREGHASRALALGLDRARDIGLDRVLVTCDDDNLASAKTIESQGGALEDIRLDQKGVPKRRYWITL